MLPFYHRPVMLDEVIAGLAIKPHGVYFDGTVGGGGHSFSILESDPTVRLIGTDRDEEAIKAETAASARALPFDQTPVGDKCVYCGKPADKVVVFAKSY